MRAWGWMRGWGKSEPGASGCQGELSCSRIRSPFIRAAPGGRHKSVRRGTDAVVELTKPHVPMALASHMGSSSPGYSTLNPVAC